MIRQIEIEVMTLIEHAIKVHDFSQIGISYVVREISRSGESDTYQSEIAIDFMRKDDIVDVVEFFIFKEGKAVATKTEISEWLSMALDDIVSSHGLRHSDG